MRDLLGMFLGLQASTPAADADFWYQPVTSNIPTASGMRVDEDQARKLSAWYRGRDILATSLAMLPFQVYERLPDDRGAKVARNHPLYGVIHDEPNESQDAFIWRRQMMFHLIDHGNGYNKIVEGPRGFAHFLEPFEDPRLVTPQKLKTGRLVYRVKDTTTGLTDTYTQDEIFHLCGASDDGYTGKGILQYARENLGTGLATESYAAHIFGKGTLNGGVIETPGVLDDEASKRMAKSFLTAVGNWHLPKVLEQGAKWVQTKLTPEDAQMLLSRQFTVDDIARWLGVPRQMLMNSDPSYGNAEQFRQDFVDFSLGQWAALFEAATNRQLVIAPRRFYVEFNRNALVRGDIAQRWAAYHMAVTDGVFTRNEVRRLENMMALDGLDEPLTPAHIVGKQNDSNANDPAPAADPPPAKGNPKAEAIAIESAARVLRKEIAEIQKFAVRYATDKTQFAQAVNKFYAKHVELVAQALQMEPDQAERYCAGQAHQIVNGAWVAALDLWKTSAYAEGLAAIAMEDAA
jgi:HK97 family phage portal protein